MNTNLYVIRSNKLPHWNDFSLGTSRIVSPKSQAIQQSNSCLFSLHNVFPQKFLFIVFKVKFEGTKNTGPPSVKKVM